MDYEALGVLGGAVAGIAAGASGVWLKVLKPMLQRLKERRARAARQEMMIEAVYAEVKPNGSGSMRDAIDRIETRQIRSEQLQDITLVDAGIASFTADVRGEWVDVNRALERLTGRSSTELTEWGWVNALHNEDAERVTEAYASAVEDRREFTGMFKVRTATGEDVPVRCNAYPLRDRAGTFTGFYGLIRRAP